MITRRLVLTGLLAAPLVVKAASLMAVRGVVMPIRGFFWGKQQSQWSDDRFNVAGQEASGVIVPFDQPDFERCTMEEETILDRMRGLVTAHGEEGAVALDRIKRFPLGIQRIAYDARYGAAYIESSLVETNAVPTWRGPA